MKIPHDLILHLEDLKNGTNPDIDRLKKERRHIFSELCIERFKGKFLLYVN